MASTATAPHEGPMEFDVVIDGRTTRVDPTDFTRSEWAVLKEKLGRTQADIFVALTVLDLDVVAGLVWLQLRRDQPDLDYEDIDLRLSDLITDSRKDPDNPPV